MKTLLTLLCALFLQQQLVFSQVTPPKPAPTANKPVSTFRVTGDRDLDSLVRKNIELNKMNNSMDGFRIQIFSGSERQNANQVKLQFLRSFPNVPVYLIYQQPYFKIRVGDFRNRIEAQNLYYELLKSYGQVLIVNERINFPKL